MRSWFLLLLLLATCDLLRYLLAASLRLRLLRPWRPSPYPPVPPPSVVFPSPDCSIRPCNSLPLSLFLPWTLKLSLVCLSFLPKIFLTSRHPFRYRRQTNDSYQSTLATLAAVTLSTRLSAFLSFLIRLLRHWKSVDPSSPRPSCTILSPSLLQGSNKLPCLARRPERRLICIILAFYRLSLLSHQSSAELVPWRPKKKGGGRHNIPSSAIYRPLSL